MYLGPDVIVTFSLELILIMRAATSSASFLFILLDYVDAMSRHYTTTQMPKISPQDFTLLSFLLHTFRYYSFMQVTTASHYIIL